MTRNTFEINISLVHVNYSLTCLIIPCLIVIIYYGNGNGLSQIKSGVLWTNLHYTTHTMYKHNVSIDTGYSPHTALISWESDIDVGRVPSLGLKTAAISTPAKECRESRLGPRHAAEPSVPGDSGGILCEIPHGRLQRKMTSPEVFPSSLTTSYSMAAVPSLFICYAHVGC